MGISSRVGFLSKGGAFFYVALALLLCVALLCFILLDSALDDKRVRSCCVVLPFLESTKRKSAPQLDTLSYLFFPARDHLIT